MLMMILTACGSPRGAVLEVGEDTLLLDSGNPITELTIVNRGGPLTVLHWQASVDSPLVHVSPAFGQVGARGPGQNIRVSVDFSSLQEGAEATAAVTVTSNGGDVVVPVRFVMTATPVCESSTDVATSPHSTRGDGSVNGDFVPGELLVAYHPPAGLNAQATMQKLAEDVRGEHGLRLLDSGANSIFERVAVDDPLAGARRLASDPRVAFAHPNYRVRPANLPNDPCFHEQWNLHGFGVPEAWSAGGGNRVVVAVIDTGFDIDHEDLRDKALPGYDLRGDDDDPRPGSPGSPASHGTHVAGIVLAAGNNGMGIAGVAHMPDVMLLPVKIFDDAGEKATIEDLAYAIMWSAGIPVKDYPLNENPADIINLSVGAGPTDIPALNYAAERARAKGALLVAAAGNHSSTDGKYGVQSPANSPAVLAVGSVDQTLLRSSFSDWGSSDPTVDLMAPGGSGDSSCSTIRSTVPWSNYSCMSGTSMAAPFVAGVAALILSGEPDLEPGDLEIRLRKAAYFHPRIMNEAEYGAGVLCAERAVAGGSHRPSSPCGSS